MNILVGENEAGKSTILEAIKIVLNQQYRFTDKSTNKNRNEEKFFLSPRLYMRYHFTSRLLASVSGRYAQNPLQEQSFHEGLILNNYRNLSQGFIDYKTGNSKSVNFNVSYRHPLKAFFANAGIARSWTYSPRISNRYFLNEYLLNTFVIQDYRSNVWMLNGNISKGVDFINGIVSVRSLYSSFDGAIFQNGKGTPYSSNSWNITPKITSRPITWCNISYELTFSQNWLEMKNVDMRTSYKNLLQLLSCNITPRKTWYLQLTGEHYFNEITQDVSKHLFLADAEFTYSLKSG